MKFDGDKGVHFDWLAAQERRTVTPLSHRCNRSLHEQGVAAHDLDLAHRAVRADDRAKLDPAGNARCTSDRRVFRLHAVDERGLHHSLAEFDRPGRRRFMRLQYIERVPASGAAGNSRTSLSLYRARRPRHLYRHLKCPGEEYRPKYPDVRE